MLAHGIHSTVLQWSSQPTTGNRLRLPYRFVLQEAQAQANLTDPKKFFRWSHAVSRSLKRLES